MIRKFTNKELYDMGWRPTDDQILAAARILDRESPSPYPSYEEMLTSDPIGASEYGGTIERMLMAAHKAGLSD